MKRILLTSIIGLATLISATSARAQAFVRLDNYDGYGAPITYGGGFGTQSGTGLANTAGSGTWTVGLYYALGNVTGSVASDPAGIADPSTLGGSLIYLSGNPGDTTTFDVPGFPGYFNTTANAIIPGYSSGLVTFEVVVFTGSTYAAATLRAHSSAFTLTPAVGPAPAPFISDGTAANPGTIGMPAFSVFLVPEPSVLALSGMGAAALMLFRRKNQASFPTLATLARRSRTKAADN